MNLNKTKLEALRKQIEQSPRLKEKLDQVPEERKEAVLEEVLLMAMMDVKLPAKPNPNIAGQGKSHPEPE